MTYKRVEHNIQSQIQEYLAYSGHKVWRNNVIRYKIDNRFIKAGEKGSGDLFSLKDGKFYSWEVKKPSGRVTAFQEQWLEDINRHGGNAHIVRSLDEVIKILTTK